MTTLFDHTGLPLWVYIVIIAVGSVLVLAILAFGLRWWYVRRNAKQRREVDGLTGGPMRRLTVRRGRVVPSSQHLSLTGSKFGMRQFGVLADNDSTMTGRRSPFEWWNSIMDRSQSRQDQMSQMETGSILTRPSSRATTIAGRREIHQPTPISTPEKTKESTVQTLELTIPSPIPSPSPLGPYKTPNFSRSFSNRAPTSPLAQRSQHTLSRISERSAHHSMISTTNGPIVLSLNRASHHSAINPVDNTPLPGPVTQPLPTTPRKSMTISAPSSQPTSQRSRPPRSDPASDQSMPPSSWRTSPREPSLEAAPRLSLPKPVAEPTSTSAPRLELPSFNSPTPDTFYRQSNRSRPDLLLHNGSNSTKTSPSASTTTLPRRSSSSIGPSGISYESQLRRPQNSRGDYWSSRTDLHDLSAAPQRPSKSSNSTPRHSRGPSVERGNVAVESSRMGIVTVPGKNNTKVLRKKSLKRMQIVSSLAT